MSDTLGLAFFVEVVLNDLVVNLIRLDGPFVVVVDLVAVVVVERRVVVGWVEGTDWPVEEPDAPVIVVGKSGTTGATESP